MKQIVLAIAVLLQLIAFPFMWIWGRIWERYFLKVEFTPEMEEMAEKLIKCEWFCNCGKSSEFDIPYTYQFVSDEEAKRKLSYVKNAKGFVVLENLIIHAKFRQSCFLKSKDKNIKSKKEHSFNQGLKLHKMIVKRYIKSQRFKVPKIENCERLEREAKNIFINILIEMYYKSKIENYPTFWIDIVDIFLQGNAVVGWNGKFPSEELEVLKWKEIPRIQQQDGMLMLW